MNDQHDFAGVRSHRLAWAFEDFVAGRARQRALTRAVRLVLAVGAGAVPLSTHADCVIGTLTVDELTTFTDNCSLTGSLTVNARFTNQGVLDGQARSSIGNNAIIDNAGLLTMAGKLAGPGTFINRGTLRVTDGGSVSIAIARNLDRTALRDGTWEVIAGTGKAALQIGSGAITTNDATILLSGAGARFDQINGLLRNNGSLTVTGGNNLQVTSKLENDGTLIVGTGSELGLAGEIQNAGSVEVGGTLSGKGHFVNAGTLQIGAGGNADLAGGDNLVNGVLTGGRWIVDAEAGGTATLRLGNNGIVTNAADVVLSGNGAAFDQLQFLARNEGSLTIGPAKSFSLTSKFVNSGLLDVAVGGMLANKSVLTNDGVISNQGVFTASGSIDGKGAFNNSGLLVVNGSQVQIAGTSNVAGGVLQGGSWSINGSRSKADLSLGTGAILINQSAIELVGALATFHQLDHLVLNGSKGSLSLRDGQLYTAANPFLNEGAVIVTNASATIAESLNLADGRLSEGDWSVAASGNAAATLQIGTGAIATNAAAIFLSGAGVRFDQIRDLQRNEGSLAMANGYVFTNTLDFENSGQLGLIAGGVLDNRGSLHNTGQIFVSGVPGSGASGQVIGGGGLTNDGTVSVKSSSAKFENVTNLANGILSGGVWSIFSLQGASVDSAALELGGGPIRTNAATIELISPNSRFAQLDMLSRNEGSLSIESGHFFTNTTQLDNPGTLAVRSGGVILNDQDILSSGRVIVDTTSRVTGTGFVRISDGLLQVDGSLAQAGVEVSGGSLQGGGVIDAALKLSGSAVLNPGNSPGTLHVNGPFSMSGGRFEIQVAGADNGQFDRLVVTETANFTGGALLFDFTGVDTPLPGDWSFDFLDAKTITGLDQLAVSFLGLAPGFDFAIDYGAGSIQFSNLHVNTVPLPGTAWLFAPAVSALGWRRRRARA